MHVDHNFILYLLGDVLYPRPKYFINLSCPIPQDFCTKCKLNSGVGACRDSVLRVIILKFHF